MLNHWASLLNTDCVVARIGTHLVYPIFKVGSTSLMSAADKILVNEEIGQCRHIEILLRDPGVRFVSGINQYSRLNIMYVSEVWQLARSGKLVDRHFAPQFVWLLHLYRYFKGTVMIRPFEYIKKITDIHLSKKKCIDQPVPELTTFVDIDYRLMDSINKKVSLKKIIEENRDALS